MLVGLGRGVRVGGTSVLAGVGAVVLVGAGAGLTTGGGVGPSLLGGTNESNVPIGVGVGADVSDDGVGDWITFGVGGRMTLGVGVGSPFGVSTTSATPRPGVSDGRAGSNVAVAPAGVGELTTVGAAIDFHSGGRTFCWSLFLLAGSTT